MADVNRRTLGTERARASMEGINDTLIVPFVRQTMWEKFKMTPIKAHSLTLFDDIHRPRVFNFFFQDIDGNQHLQLFFLVQK